MKYFNSPNIYYLEQQDFTPEYQLQSPLYKNNRRLFSGLTVLLVQGNYCGYCNDFKPIFQQVADQLSDDIDFATIQIDSHEPGETFFKGDGINYIINQQLEGVPLIVKMGNGFVLPNSSYQGNRQSANEFYQWVINN